MEILIKWNGKDFRVKLLPSHCVSDLKEELAKQTNVLPDRQKLLGLKTKAGQMASISTLLDDLNYKSTTKIMMMGTVEEKIDDINKKPENLPEVVDDFDPPNVEEIHLQNREENLAKISKRVKDYKVTVLNEPRLGKKLLVLDIDYTIFDHASFIFKKNSKSKNNFFE